MRQILYERNPAPGKLDVLGVDDWPMWEKEVSEQEQSYLTRTIYTVR